MSLKVILCVLILLFLLNITYYFYNHTHKTVKYRIQKYQNDGKPLIVLCTDFHFEKFLNKDILNALKQCPYQCRISDNFKRDYHFADIAIFHARNMTMNEEIKTSKNPNRLNIFYSMEVFPHERIRRKRFPKDFFNLTMSFRRDSTIWKPYDQFEKFTKLEKKNRSLVWTEKEINKVIAKKTKLAVQIVSHCETYSLREKFTGILERFMNISTFGVCNKKFVNGSENENKILGEHFFYLAFENAVCDDYVTEKFWRLKQLIVPVVLKRSILKGLIDDEYFIAADDFNSTQALADKLIYLSKNITEYKKYLRWTKMYKKTSAYDEREFCKICEMAVKKEKHTVPDIYEWWEKETKCYFNHLNYSLRTRDFHFNKPDKY